MSDKKKLTDEELEIQLKEALEDYVNRKIRRDVKKVLDENEVSFNEINFQDAIDATIGADYTNDSYVDSLMDNIDEDTDEIIDDILNILLANSDDDESDDESED